MNSGGSGRTWVWPGATMLAPRKGGNIPRRHRNAAASSSCGQLILREQKYSVPSSAISTRPLRRWNGVEHAAVSIACEEQRIEAAGEAPSSIRRI